MSEYGMRCPHRLVVDVEVTADESSGYTDAAGRHVVLRNDGTPITLQMECNVPNKYVDESCWRVININGVLHL